MHPSSCIRFRCHALTVYARLQAKVKVKIDVSDEEVEVASVKQLQQWCQQMGLKKSGKKAELQQRVL